jgi:DNA-binding transcriptional regulator GbsR (MarR family)
MNRTEFIITATVILFIAFLLGWAAHWLLHRFTRVAAGDVENLETLAKNLHQAEEAREAAETMAEKIEKDLSSKLAQAEAERTAAMDTLRDLRNELDELRAYVEQTNKG